MADDHSTNRYEPPRHRAIVAVTAAELEAADRQLQAAYLKEPQDLALVEAAARLAASTALEW